MNEVGRTASQWKKRLASPVVYVHRIRSAYRRAMRWGRLLRIGLEISEKFRGWETEWLEAERKNKITPEIQARHDTLEELRRFLNAKP